MSVVSIFSMPQLAQLFTSGGAPNMNYPINRTDLRIFRGVTTTLTFVLYDVDRKPVVLDEGFLPLWTMLDRRTQEVLISRTMTVLDAAKGRYEINITPEEVDRLALGGYRYSVVIEGPNGLTPLYTDRNYTLDGTVELRSGPFSQPVPTITIEKEDFAPDLGRLVSGAYPGAAQTNSDGHHQIVVYSNSMPYGYLLVQASLETDPSNQMNEWFDVTEFSLDEITSPVTAFSFEGQFVWVRFVLVPDLPEDTEEFSKILYRS